MGMKLRRKIAIERNKNRKKMGKNIKGKHKRQMREDWGRKDIRVEGEIKEDEMKLL